MQNLSQAGIKSRPSTLHSLANWNSSESESNCSTSSTTKPNMASHSHSSGSSSRNHSHSHSNSSSRNRHIYCNWWLVMLCTILLIENAVAVNVKADELSVLSMNSRTRRYAATTPLSQDIDIGANTTTVPVPQTTTAAAAGGIATTELPQEDWQPLNSTQRPIAYNSRSANGTATGTGNDSLLLRIARRFSTGNELWDGIIQDCYAKPSYACFQKNVFSYLNGALDVQDLNVTQRLKFYRNQVAYDTMQQQQHEEAATTHEARAAETPIEEVTNALYGKSIKFAMTHDVELQLPEVMFDGATFRISPRAIEGNGIIAKLELIPKQEVQARLAGKIIMKKIQKFLRSKLLLSFLALLVIIKIIKIKLFWLLPIVIGVGAAKKLLLKFLLFLFPALSHLFKLCSYYQQSYQTTKYHHHHHLINHHHTVVPPWHSGEHHGPPEIIYTHPPKGHPSAYLHGAPLHESHGPGPGHAHFEGAWENSGPGLGSEYIADINRVAQVEENAPYFKPHTANDANELHAWGLGTTQLYPKQQMQQQQQQERWPATQQQRPPTPTTTTTTIHKQQHKQHQLQKQHASSHSFNPFQSQEKQSSRPNIGYAQSAPSPVYAPGPPGSAAAQIAAQYEPARHSQQQLPPELSAQLKEAIRIQAEQRIIAQQQQILEHQPFVQDGQPLYPLNYDPFYSPILVKIDKIIEQLGIKNDLCKERVVCSMYKDPASYSPHSNFLSAELSRETSELEPVTNTNEAVRRFFALIQAAREGQDQKDCHSLYPQCNIPTK